MLNLINDWFKHIVVPREELSNFPICPYAKQAIANKSYAIEECNLENIHSLLNLVDVTKHSVTILIFKDYLNYEVDKLSVDTSKLNTLYNLKDLVILDNDPRTPFVLNGVTTSFEHCYLWLVQSLSDLNEKSSVLEKSSYYSHWTKQQMDDVVNWRK
jgi:hypothetical protein